MPLTSFAQRADDAALLAYVGRTGSGKTLWAYDYALEAMSLGHQCFGNLRPDWAACKWWAKRRYGREISEAQFIPLEDAKCREFWQHVPRGTRSRKVVGVFDEAREFLDTRRGKDEEFESAIVHQRKAHIEILFLTQRFAYLLPRVRGELHAVTYLRDMRRHPALQLIWPRWYHLVHFIECEQAEMRLIEARRGFVRVPKGLYRVYCTDELHGRAAGMFGGITSGFDTREKAVPMSRWAKAASAAAALGAAWSVYQVQGMAGTVSQVEASAAAVNLAASNVVATAAASSNVTAAAVSDVWDGIRVGSYGLAHGGGGRVLVLREGGRIDQVGTLTADGVLVSADAARCLYDAMGTARVLVQGRAK